MANEVKTPIPARIYNAAVGGHVAGTEDIYDDTKGKTQKQINTEVEQSLGSGGSVDSRIQSAVNNEKSRAEGVENSQAERITTLENAVGSGGSVDERIATEGAKHYLKSETYTKDEVHGLITTPNQQYITVTATNQTTAVTDVLPASGEADTVYRVGNWNGSTYDDTVYSEYAWNGTAYVFLRKKDYGIDDEPTAGSDNLVKSGGVVEKIDETKESIIKIIGFKNISGTTIGDGVNNHYIIGNSTNYGFELNCASFRVKLNNGDTTHWRILVFLNNNTKSYQNVTDDKIYDFSPLIIEGITVYSNSESVGVESIDFDITFGNRQEVDTRFTRLENDLAIGFTQVDVTTGVYKLLENQVEGYVGSRIMGGVLYATSSAKALTTALIPIDKTKRYKLRTKIGPYNDGLAYYASDGTTFVGFDNFHSNTNEIVEHELTIPNNAYYMRFASSNFDDAYAVYEYNYNLINPASKEYVNEKISPINGDIADINQDIEYLYGVVEPGGEIPENVVRYTPQKTLYLGANILSTVGATFDSTYWEVENGVIKYLGGGNYSKTFEFGSPTINGQRYFAEITAYTQSGTYEGLFYIRIGNGTLVDTYNGTPNTFGGLISDGGKLVIQPYAANAFEIREITLRPVLTSDEEEGYEKSVTITTENVGCGNSAQSSIGGKWNVAVGPTLRTMAGNINGSRSVAVGFEALKNWQSGMQNVAIGSFALYGLIEGSTNIAIGSDCLWQTKLAQANIAIGKTALASYQGAVHEALLLRNIAIGEDSMGHHREGLRDSIAIGYHTNREGVPYSVFIGSECDLADPSSWTAQMTNIIAIGYNVKPTKSNQCIIGNANVSEFILGNKKIIFNQDGTVSWEAV